VLRLIGFRLGAARLRLRFVLAIVFGCRCSHVEVKVCVGNWVCFRCNQVESVWKHVEGLC
jgi:hypothetical protein